MSLIQGGECFTLRPLKTAHESQKATSRFRPGRGKTANIAVRHLFSTEMSADVNKSGKGGMGSHPVSIIT